MTVKKTIDIQHTHYRHQHPSGISQSAGPSASRAIIGGFHVDNVDNTYQFIGVVGYRFKMWDVSSKVFAGYRYLHIDYEKRNVDLQLDIKGPLLGIGWEF